MKNFGIVKWFGGYNSRTERENNFGFVIDASGIEAFLHKSAVVDGVFPSEKDLLFLQIEPDSKRKDKWTVKKAISPEDKSITIEDLHLAAHLLINKPQDSIPVRSIARHYESKLLSISTKELRDHITEFGPKAVLSILDQQYRSQSDQISLNEILLNTGLVKPFEDIPLEEMSSNWLQKNLTIKDLYQAAKQLNEGPQSAITIHNIAKQYESKLLSISSEELYDHMREVGPKAVLARLGHQYHDGHYRSPAHQIRLNETLLDTGLVQPFEDIPIDKLSSDWLINNQLILVGYLNSIDDEACLSVFRDNSHILPEHIVIYLIAKGVIKSYEQLGDFQKNFFKDFLCTLLEDKATNFPKYLQAFVEEDLTSKGGLKSVPFIRDHLEELEFKKSLFDKNPKFSTLFSDSVYLQKNLDLFILHTLFSLVHVGHTQEEIYNGFMEIFWRAIMTGRYDLKDQEEQILRLFPPCHTIYQRNNQQDNPHDERSALSCEAVYWDKQDMFLCRGTKCRSPQILGSETDDYQQFSIFDWFRHYHIDYLNQKQPNKQDFPIKLAGYINRMREIFDVLHCRSCGSLMTPDLAYARTQQVKYENGIPIVENLAAAYRLTVFRCAETSCEEYDKGHYINHCLNFYCHDLIDSRDSTTRCDNGLLICRHCASCCSQHDKSNPVGLCPECGSDLKLFRDPDKRNAYNDRFVACTSSNCAFIFESEKLPKKFTKLKSVQVMYARPKDVCCPNSSSHPTLGEQPPFYCDEDLSRY